MRYILVVIFFTVGCVFAARAQKPDTVMKKNPTDSIYKKKDQDASKAFDIKPKKIKGAYYPDSTHSPRKAWTRSALVPGLGQIYNGHWWKVPAIYAGLGLLANAAIENQKNYKDFLAIAQFRRVAKPVDDPMYANETPERIALYKRYGASGTGISDEAIINAKDGFYRNKEISILSFFLVWGVNVVDAYIYGKLQHSYSMDNDFKVNISTTTLQQPVYASNFNFNTFTPAIKVTLTF